MAAISYLQISSTPHLARRRGFHCSSSDQGESQTPRLLKIAVAGVTELLRIFSSGTERLDTVNYIPKVEPSISCIDDIIDILRLDYENAYFLTGNFTSSIYSENCTFEDPTIKFRGDSPNWWVISSLGLKIIQQFGPSPGFMGAASDTKSVLAIWKLRTYLKLPWKPLISIEGSTLYEFDDELKIVRHAESWNVSALEAVGQIFTPGTKRLS